MISRYNGNLVRYRRLYIIVSGINNTSSWFQIRDYLQVNSNVEIATEQLQRAVDEGQKGDNL